MHVYQIKADKLLMGDDREDAYAQALGTLHERTIIEKQTYTQTTPYDITIWLTVEVPGEGELSDIVRRLMTTGAFVTARWLKTRN